jgi:hypothetical protein
MLKLVRRRYLLLGVVVLSLLAGVYYANYAARDVSGPALGASSARLTDDGLQPPPQLSQQPPAKAPAEAPEWNERDTFISADNCPVKIDTATADVDTVDTFKNFEFQVSVYKMLPLYVYNLALLVVVCFYLGLWPVVGQKFNRLEDKSLTAIKFFI